MHLSLHSKTEALQRAVSSSASVGLYSELQLYPKGSEIIVRSCVILFTLSSSEASCGKPETLEGLWSGGSA